MGFGVAECLAGFGLNMRRLGGPDLQSPMATMPQGDLVLTLGVMGLIGAGSALAAWLSARKSARVAEASAGAIGV